MRFYLHLKWSTQHKQQLLMLPVFFIQYTSLYSLLTTHVANNFLSQARLLHSNSVHQLFLLRDMSSSMTNTEEYQAIQRTNSHSFRSYHRNVTTQHCTVPYSHYTANKSRKQFTVFGIRRLHWTVPSLTEALKKKKKWKFISYVMYR